MEGLHSPSGMCPRRRRLRAGATVGFAAALQLWSCACVSRPSEVVVVLRRTVPAGAETPSLDGPHWTGTAARYRWTIATDLSPEAYANWLRVSLREYSAGGASPSDLTFSRRTIGDVYRLQVSAQADGSRTTVRCVFVAQPD